jgi:GNAT superfamily N-acetyltransferase
MADAPAVAALIAACQVADGDPAEMTTAELLNDWDGANLDDEALVVLAPNGQLAAYADLVNRRYVRVSIYGYVHPAQTGRGLGAYLSAWGERWARAHLAQAPEGTRVVVEHYVRASNAAAGELLPGRGFAPVRTIYVMAITLAATPPAPEWPAGITARPFVPGTDERATFEAVEEAFADTWNRPPGVYERWLEWTRLERQEPGLWLLARDKASGEIAGACLAKRTGEAGWIGTVAVRRPWRRQGLALALLRQAFAALWQRGIREVSLSVDSESPTGAPRVYSRAGMHVSKSFTLFQKELRAGVPLQDGQ